MINKITNDWITGDLLVVTRSHYFVKGNPDSVWPDVFERIACNEYDNYTTVETPTEVPIGTVVMALDPKPELGKYAVIRVLYDNGVWVANSNFIQKKQSCIIVNQEKSLS